ncbi:MAG: thioredoxin [bacterium]
MVRDVTDSDFEQQVVERSREVPVLVDFWAEWCGPCRQLTPALEAAVSKRAGQVELAKVDVDANQTVARSFEIRGIPAVKAFKDGQVVSEFTGAIPPKAIDSFLDELLPSPADELLDAGDEQSLRKAVELDPRHAEAALALARLLIERGDRDQAGELLERFKGDFIADGLAARLQLETGSAVDGIDASTLERAFGAWDAADHNGALEALQEAFQAATTPETRDLLRQAMVAIFTELGPEDPVAKSHRRRLASAL